MLNRVEPFENIQVVCFDLDNTLVDLIRVKRAAAEAAGSALAYAGMRIDPSDAADQIFATALRVGIDRDDIVHEYVAELGHVNSNWTVVGQHAYERAEYANAVAYPGAHATLIELTRRGYKLAVITDASRSPALRRLEAARLTPFFQHIITFDETGVGKSTVTPYALLSNRMNVAPTQLVMVGDNPRLDIGTARSFGMKTVLAQYGLQEHYASTAPNHTPDHSIDWLDQLLPLLPPRDGSGRPQERERPPQPPRSTPV